MCEISANTAEEMRDSVKLIQIIMFRQISHAIYHANCISDFSATMTYVYAQLHAVCVTIFSNGSIILTGFKFTELHVLTLAARSYALLF